MKPSAFWSDLESRFLALHQEQLQHPGQGALSALWDGRTWHLGDGYDSNRISKNFRVCAESAARRIGPPRRRGHVPVWLNLLREKSGAYHPFEPKGGKIEFVCKVSAEYCLECRNQEDAQGKGRENLVSVPSHTSLDIVKRRAIVKQNPGLAAVGICRMFDDEEIPLTKNMREAGSWAKAYNSSVYRHSIDALICRDRKS